jgi:hypothetical protein
MIDTNRQAYYEEVAELSEQHPLTLTEACEFIGWKPVTVEETRAIERLCNQYGIRTTEDWQVWVDNL